MDLGAPGRASTRNGQEPNLCGYWLISYIEKFLPTSPPRYKVSAARFTCPHSKTTCQALFPRTLKPHAESRFHFKMRKHFNAVYTCLPATLQVGPCQQTNKQNAKSKKKKKRQRRRERFLAQRTRHARAPGPIVCPPAAPAGGSRSPSGHGTRGRAWPGQRPRPSRLQHRFPPPPLLRGRRSPSPWSPPGPTRRLQCLRLRPATPCGNPGAPGSPSPGRMEADGPRELASKPPYHGCAKHEKRTTSFRSPRKKGRRLRAPEPQAPRPVPPFPGAPGFYLATCWWEVIGPRLGQFSPSRFQPPPQPVFAERLRGARHSVGGWKCKMSWTWSLPSRTGPSEAT